MKDFLTFRKMILPIIIQVLFWLGVVGCIIGGIITMIGGVLVLFQGSGSAVAAGLTSIASGLGILLIGPFVVRIYAELLIIFFRINDTLTDIKNALQTR